MKKAIKIIGITFAAFFLLIASYAAYLLVTYDRIADMQELSIIQPQDITESAPTSLQLGEEYSAATYNIGFGAYTPEYSFFMDGGKSSWAASKESVLNTVEGASSLIAALDPDFALIQEIDLVAMRSYHICLLYTSQAAFVDIGLERNAFLYAGDIQIDRSDFTFHGQQSELKSAPLNIKDIVKPGQEVLVQIVKEPIGTKGCLLYTSSWHVRIKKALYPLFGRGFYHRNDLNAVLVPFRKKIQRWPIAHAVWVHMRMEQRKRQVAFRINKNCGFPIIAGNFCQRPFPRPHRHAVKICHPILVGGCGKAGFREDDSRVCNGAQGICVNHRELHVSGCACGTSRSQKNNPGGRTDGKRNNP